MTLYIDSACIPFDDGVCESDLQFDARNDPRVSCQCMPRYVAGEPLPLDVETPVNVPSRRQPVLQRDAVFGDASMPRELIRVLCHQSSSVPGLIQGE